MNEEAEPFFSRFSRTEVFSLRLLFSAAYFAQGVPAGFRAEAVYNLLVESGARPAVIANFVFIGSVPWFLQFLWGPLIDRVASVGARRTGQIVIFSFGLLAFASCALYGVRDPGMQIGMLSAGFFIHSSAASLLDTAVDAHAIRTVPEKHFATVNASMRIGYAVGVAVGASVLSEFLSLNRFRVAVTVIVALTAIVGFFCRKLIVDARRGRSFVPIRDAARAADRVAGERHPWRLRPLVQLMLQKKRLRVFLLIWFSSLVLGVFGNSFSYFLIRNLKWSAKKVSQSQGGWVLVAGVAFIALGSKVVTRMGPRAFQKRALQALGFLMLSAGLFGTSVISEFGQTGLFLSSLIDPLVCLGAIPILMEESAGIHAATLFTLYMALLNLSDSVAAKLSATVVDRAPFFAITIASGVSLLALAYFFRVPTSEVRDADWKE